MDEINADADLRSQLNASLRRRKDRNPYARYGRRTGWYVLVPLSRRW